MSKENDMLITMDESDFIGHRRFYWFCGFLAGVCGSGALTAILDGRWLMLLLLLLAVVGSLFYPILIVSYLGKRKGK